MTRRKLAPWLLLTVLLSGPAICQAQTPPTASTTQPPAAKRDWGPEQACGAPDTQNSGDIPTAWASLTQDEQDEWLMLMYEKDVTPVQVLVYETFNPGALSKVTAFDKDGKEVEVWSGTDPTPTTVEQGISKIPVKPNFATRRIKLYLDSKKVPGWNEIDAVGLVDEQTEKPIWATEAQASSTYADRPDTKDPVEEMQMRINHLEKQVQEMQQQIDELKGKRKKKP